MATLETQDMNTQPNWNGLTKRLDMYSDHDLVDFVFGSKYKDKMDPLTLELARRLKNKVLKEIWDTGAELQKGLKNTEL